MRARPRSTGNLRIFSRATDFTLVAFANPLSLPVNSSYPPPPVIVLSGAKQTPDHTKAETGKNHTCGEQEHGHRAVVLLLGPPAERDHSH